MNMSQVALKEITEREYKRRIWAWTMYDWANSAFATTILAAILPIYFSQVAGATLPSATVATSYWSLGLSISLLIVAILSPILGTISDVMRGKKLFLSLFAGLGISATALLVLVSTGDWILASILGVLGRIGFNGANTFYDALLPHVARSEDQDRVSARGYAMGYLGGGLLLAINVVMIQVFPGTWGARLSFLSVAIWWAVFSIPLIRRVPEPPAASVKLHEKKSIIYTSFHRLIETMRDVRSYRELFKFLFAFLIYNDGIGTIIGVAAIYGAELGFGSTELILALLLVQFVGIPYSLIFGRLPSPSEKRRANFLAFVIFNMVALPLIGIWSARSLPVSFTGMKPAPFPPTANAVGEGSYPADHAAIQYTGEWQQVVIPAHELGSETDEYFMQSMDLSARADFAYNGLKVKLNFSQGPDHGRWLVMLDDTPWIDPDTGEPLVLDGYHPTMRYDGSQTVQADSAGEHLLSLVNTQENNPQSDDHRISLASVEVLPATIEVGIMGILRILGFILLIQAVGLVFAFLLGKPLFGRLSQGMTTKRAILLALSIYTIVAIWGYFLNSVIEFWFLAWMIAIVQGGSQALSRSLYSAMSPKAKSGEFFGLFGVMEKFSAIIGPLMFAAAGTLFGSSRPAVLSLIILFILGGLILVSVNVEHGKQVAQRENEEAMAEG
jgi:UMF1 family MFS transporter